MNDLDLASTLEDLAAHRIEEIRFSLPGSGKYRDCAMYWAYEEYPVLGKKAPSFLIVRLGKVSEIRFPKSINPDLVRFSLPQGKLGLKDVWKKLEVTKVRRQ